MICSGKTMNFLVAIIVLLIAQSKSLKFECPEPEDVYPCYCEEEDNEPVLFCNHFHKPEQIYNSLKGLGEHKIVKVSFFMNWILDPIKSDAFKNVVAQKILFENSTINLLSPQFQGMESNLKSIQMRACFNKTNPIGTWSLGHLKNLKELHFDKNRITTLPNNWLTSVPESLTSLTVEDNSIITLEDEVFSKVKSVVFMVLDSNRLTALSRSMFPKPASALRSLSLNYNKLRYLPYDLFTDMPNLRIVEMTNNRLTILEDNVWKNIFVQLTKLDFSDNLLQCDNTLKWLLEASSKPVLLYGECDTPEKMKGKSIKRLRDGDI